MPNTIANQRNGALLMNGNKILLAPITDEVKKKQKSDEERIGIFVNKLLKKYVPHLKNKKFKEALSLLWNKAFSSDLFNIDLKPKEFIFSKDGKSHSFQYTEDELTMRRLMDLLTKVFELKKI